LSIEGNFLQLDTHIKIGTAILDKYAKYAETQVIDDRAEYFPTVRVIINGIVGILESPIEKEKTESILIDHVKQKYVSLWLKHSAEDDEAPDIDYETKRANDVFNNLFFNK
jgi:hypothetical protein